MSAAASSPGSSACSSTQATIVDIESSFREGTQVKSPLWWSARCERPPSLPKRPWKALPAWLISDAIFRGAVLLRALHPIGRFRTHVAPTPRPVSPRWIAAHGSRPACCDELPSLTARALSLVALSLVGGNSLWRHVQL